MIERVKSLFFIPKCKVCGKPADLGNLCKECNELLTKEKFASLEDPPKSEILGVDKVYYSYLYQGRARAAVIRAKFTNPASFLESLWEDISIDIENILGQNIVDQIMSTPFHPSKLYDSEYDLPLEMGKKISKYTGVPLSNPVKKVLKTKRQHDLSLRERKANLIGAFEVTGDVKGKNILIVDDVITTGTTLSTLAMLMKASGRNKIFRWAYTLNTGKDSSEVNDGERK